MERLKFFNSFAYRCVWTGYRRSNGYQKRVREKIKKCSPIRVSFLPVSGLCVVWVLFFILQRFSSFDQWSLVDFDNVPIVQLSFEQQLDHLANLPATSCTGLSYYGVS
jgi:hypothetical protein